MKVSYEGQHLWREALQPSNLAITSMDFQKKIQEPVGSLGSSVLLENLVRLPRPPVTRLKAWSRVMAR